MKQFTLIVVLFFCSSVLFAQDVLMQNGTFNQCSGTLYDSGGVDGTYADNESLVLTICPDGPDQFIQLAFTTFGTQIGFDELTIYDGDDTTGAVLGVYSGAGAANNPGTISAATTSATGCITLEFVSDAGGNTTGWAADISCLQSCQTITPTIDTTNPVANGGGIIQIPVGDSIDFTGSATFSDDGTGAVYTWNYGDGTAAVDGESVNHQFNNIGTFTTTFTVTDANPTGCSESVTITIEVLSPYIQVDQTTYTVPELVEDVLIDSPCAAVSNINWSTGTNFGDVNGIGYFSAITGAFAFEAGIVLNSGNAMEAEGPESGIQSSGGPGWPGDADLEAAINTDLDNIAGDDLPAGGSRNASFIEFDFVPIANSISFDFLFASEEYGNFQCSFSDAFAFLLTDNVTGVTNNLALVPGTTDVVSVFTVRDNAFDGGCSSENITYFDSYYGAGGQPLANSPIDYRGYTVAMTAFSNVTPNNSYTIKLVVADARDTSYNSAVFLGAGTFDLGGDLGDDLTITAGTAECQGTSITLDTGLPTATHTWYLDGAVISGETGSTLDALVEGTYSVDIVFSATCQTSDSIFIEFIPGPTVEAVDDITECDSGGPVIFDLTENETTAVGTQDPATIVVTFHNSQADADADVNPITNPSTYTGTDGEAIYIRVDDVESGTCYATEEFQLLYLNIVLNAATDIEVCDDVSNDGVESFNLTSKDGEILGTQAATDFNVTYYTDFANADAGTNALTSPYLNTGSPQPIFVRIESIEDPVCYIASATAVFNLVVNPLAIATQPINVEICDDPTNDGVEVFDLTALETEILDGQDPTDYTVSFYTLQTDVETSTNPITNPATYSNTDTPTQTIYVRVDDNLNPTCFGETSFTITVNAFDNSTFTMQPTCDGAIVDTVVLSGGTYVLNPMPTDGATIDAAIGTITGGTSLTSYTVEYTTNGTCPSTSSFTVMVDETLDATFTMTASCDGGTVVTETTPGGTYAFNPLPTDGASIDPVTGTVTGGTSSALYIVEYSFGGDCPSSTTVDLIVNPTDDALFTYTPTCDGAIINTVETPGGTYSFNITPTDGATLDSATGTISGGTPGADYTVDYLTNGICPASSTLVVTANPLPTIIDPTPLEVCDDGTPDGITEIDLTLKNNEISGGNPAYAVTYYFTQADADGQVNPLVSPYTNVVPNMQTIYVGVQDTNTGCYDTTSLDLVVEQAPVAFTPADLEYCDPDSDGFGEFMLSDTEAEITGGAPGLTVTYHETMADADNNVNALASPYNNIVVNTQTIYIRVESSTIATDCATFVDLILTVNPTPQITTAAVLTPLEVCDDNADGFASFNLPTKEPEILNLLDADATNDLDSTLYTITYYTSEANAEAPINAIATPNAYVNTTV
ncbi:choice-of-anchor L domain-containing protein, partial [Lacinutrix mariniflava]|uniref:choice-of-anchor L domain-containing protein n=1 Tax=Lacinutrix mariniflava TaxID=342955 RepID=UPI0006E417DA